MPACAHALLQQFGAKLFGQEWIGVAVIDQHIGKPRAVLDQCDRVVLAPGRAIVAEISAERLDAPWHLRRRDDWRERAGRAIAMGCRSATVSAPWPPIECPRIDCLLASTGNCPATNSGSSSVT